MLRDIAKLSGLNPADHGDLPFLEIKKTNKRIRIFSPNISNDELKWHWDEEDRTVIVVSGENWQIQLDNELPQHLICGRQYFIKAGRWHRIIKGTTDLIVEIC